MMMKESELAPGFTLTFTLSVTLPGRRIQKFLFYVKFFFRKSVFFLLPETRCNRKEMRRQAILQLISHSAGGDIILKFSLDHAGKPIEAAAAVQTGRNRRVRGGEDSIEGFRFRCGNRRLNTVIAPKLTACAVGIEPACYDFPEGIFWTRDFSRSKNQKRGDAVKRYVITFF